MNVNVEILRKAARLMRERAEGVYPPQTEWRELVMAHTGTALDHALFWSPAVALVVADWLDSHATDLASAGGNRLSCDSPGDLDMAVRVARAYLAGEWS